MLAKESIMTAQTGIGGQIRQYDKRELFHHCSVIIPSCSTYDALGHCVAKLDAMGTHKLTWTIDSQGRTTCHANLEKQGGNWVTTLNTSYAYDAAGRLVNQTSSAGQDITYHYIGELVGTIEDQGTHQITTYSYDRAGNRVREQITYTSDNAHTPGRVQNNTSTYDLQGRLASVTDDVYTLRFTYDKNGNRIATHTEFDREVPDPNWDYDSRQPQGTVTERVSFDAYNTYDEMNRQLIVNGALATDGKIVIGAIGVTS